MTFSQQSKGMTAHDRGLANLANAQMPNMHAPNAAATIDIPAAKTSPMPANGPEPLACSEICRNQIAMNVPIAAINSPQMEKTTCSTDA